MKIKYPKKIKISDTVFRIIYDNNWNGGAEFAYPSNGKKAFIRFGMLDSNPSYFLAMLIHEVKEIIQVEQAVRYNKPGEDRKFEFHYTHSEHSDMCCRLAGIISEFIK